MLDVGQPPLAVAHRAAEQPVISSVATGAATTTTSAPSHAAAIVVLVVGVLAVVAAVIAAGVPRFRSLLIRTTVIAVGVTLSVYFVARGIAEFWVVNYNDPSTYQHDWGGPSLLGVFAVHTGPGLAILLGVMWWVERRFRLRRDSQSNVDGAHT